MNRRKQSLSPKGSFKLCKNKIEVYKGDSYKPKKLSIIRPFVGGMIIRSLLDFSEIDIHTNKKTSAGRDEIIIIRNNYSEYIIKAG
jgi:hypothetical protein